MATGTITSDAAILDLLGQRGPLAVSELVQAMGVTATAVRQRLARMMAQGQIDRSTAQTARGRPSHRYLLTAKGREQLAADQGRPGGGSNFADLAVVLWHEIRAVKDPAIRSGLLQRIASVMARQYAPQVSGGDTAERMRAVQSLFDERRVPLEVDSTGRLPVVTALACPYPELAEQDRGICAVEKMLFSELIGQRMKLSACRLDGADCCRFEGQADGEQSADAGEQACLSATPQTT